MKIKNHGSYAFCGLMNSVLVLESTEQRFEFVLCFLCVFCKINWHKL